MRISTHQAFLSGLTRLQDGQANVYGLQEQIASGKRVETPGDDPIAAPQIIALKRQIAQFDQYQSNADRATNRLNLEESVLDSIGDTLQSVRQLTVQAGDAALDFGSRQSIASELQQRVDELLGLVNTQGMNNEYLFSGYQADRQPFERDSGGGFSYQGDEGQLFIPIGNDLNVAASDSGKALFAEIEVPNNFTVTIPEATVPPSVPPVTLNTGTGMVQTSAVTNQADYDAFYPDDAVITFTVVGTTTTYSVTEAPPSGAAISGGTPLQELTDIPYTQGEAIAFEGIQLHISGAPADGDEFTALSSPPQKLGMLTIIEQFAAGLNDGGVSNLQRGELVSDALLGLDNVLSTLNQTVAKIGARLNTIESIEDANSELKLFSQATLSKVEDLDFTEAISQLTQSNFVLQAAQQSYLKVSNLSLFNFMR